MSCGALLGFVTLPQLSHSHLKNLHMVSQNRKIEFLFIDLFMELSLKDLPRRSFLQKDQESCDFFLLLRKAPCVITPTVAQLLVYDSEEVCIRRIAGIWDLFRKILKLQLAS